jgi:hypothetical protein
LVEVAAECVELCEEAALEGVERLVHHLH